VFKSLRTRAIVPFAVVLLLLPSGSASAAPTPVSFSAPAVFATAGFFPFAVAIGDLNGDGKPDLVVANSGNPSTVSVLRGDGHGGFAAATTYPSGGFFASSVAIGDLNGDGRADVAVTNINSNNVCVLLGTGGGALGPPTCFRTGTALDLAPRSVVIADLNGDGKLDLVVANPNANNVGVLLGNGTGAFALAANYPTGSPSEPLSVAIADLNSDGRLDLAVANNSGGLVVILLGNGDGTFAPAVGYPLGAANGRAVAIGDLNGDGRPDLVVGTLSPGLLNPFGVMVLLGNGAGGFGTATHYVAASFGFPEVVSVGDLNSDGSLDLVTANGSVWLGDGLGGFGPAVSLTLGAANPNSLAVGDLNGDGMPDLVFGNGVLAGNVSVLLNRLAPPDTTPPSITVSTAPPANANGWNNSDVTVTWSVSDPESGIASATGCDATTIAVETAGVTLTCSARNGAGLTNSASVLIKIDKTAPIIAFNGNAGAYTVDQTVLITCVASDALSGIATTSCPAVASGPATNFVGSVATTSTTLTATATDEAGNFATASTTFTVTVTADGICRLSASLATADSICAMATSIEAAANSAAKAGKLIAFDKFMAAQSGKSIPADLATLLSGLADLL
jgi:VCBS repeat protein/FG-GAP repeat protein